MTREWTIHLHAIKQPRRRHVNRPVMAVLLMLAGCSLLYRYDAPRRDVSAPMLTPSALLKAQLPVQSVQLAGSHDSRSGLGPMAMDVSLSSRSTALLGQAGGVAATRLSGRRMVTLAPGQVSVLAVQLPNVRSNTSGSQSAVTLDIFSSQ